MMLFILFVLFCNVTMAFCDTTVVSETQPKKNAKFAFAMDDLSYKNTQKVCHDYLEKWYPKALVIQQDFFTNKDPNLVASTLQALVDVLASKPWFYVANKQAGFEPASYWEFFIDQCAMINAYLRFARVDLESKTVYQPDYACLMNGNKKKSKRIIDYLKANNNAALGAFYAYSYDAVVKMFNEGIMLKDLAKATRYLSDLEFIVKKLQGTPYEPDYQEHLKTAKDLLALLKHRCGTDDAALIEQIFGNDEKSRKMMNESMKLGIA